MPLARRIALILGILAAQPIWASEKLTIAAASDLRYALSEIVEHYRSQYPEQQIQVIFGSSGKMTTQIIHGAPYDIFFSADIAFPERLKAQGLTSSEPTVYALGRIVLWSKSLDASQLTLADLAGENIRRIAIAQPAHAPYGARAREALQAAGVWEQVQAKLVFGENIAHAVQMAESQAVDVGIIALSLAVFPDLAQSGHSLIDASLHRPLTQGFVVTRRARDNPAAHGFAHYMKSDAARQVMLRYGFVVPDNDTQEAEQPPSQ
jgi:molybdate transport system substrate-binding protein